MKKLLEKYRKTLRWIYCGVGAAAVTVVFQACYGAPQASRDDIDDCGGDNSGTVSCAGSSDISSNVNEK